MTPPHWVAQFAALGCTSVLIDAWLRYRPFRTEDGRFSWIEAEPHEEGVTEKPHRIVIRPAAEEPFLVIWHPDEMFLQTMRRSRFAMRSIDPPHLLPESEAVLARLVRRLQDRPLRLMKRG